MSQPVTREESKAVTVLGTMLRAELTKKREEFEAKHCEVWNNYACNVVRQFSEMVAEHDGNPSTKLQLMFPSNSPLQFETVRKWLALAGITVEFGTAFSPAAMEPVPCYYATLQ